MKQEFSSPKEQQQSTASHQQQEQHTATGREFATVEDMLRFDATQVEPPETVVTRLKDSLAQEPPPRASWWRRFWPW
jgi:hypothetical protein